ncbi:MAG TPA: hypothetical protein DCM05_15030, partial [Elusimicrobia bacterium]|nr:hypothetical protein [Elusimicrobiota bacterium]
PATNPKFSDKKCTFLFWGCKESDVEHMKVEGKSYNYGAGPGDDGTQNELWPMIAEKAYAQHKGSYKKIEGGHGADA